ncbi:MAG: SNF2-related protein [Nanoarchaeota archaeon]
MVITINESFDDDSEMLKKLDEKKYDSPALAKLNLSSQEVMHDSEIKEIMSYEAIRKNLLYELPHQKEGALKILRDLKGSGLLADEVGLGKTVTAGIVIKECLHRGIVKKALILTPPSLVDQWVAELKEKFELDFKIIEKEEDWLTANLVVASMDRVKVFDKDKGDFRHSEAHKIAWDLLIVDEAHKLKDRNTRRWEFVDKIQKKRFLVLTATPFQNDLLELYNLLHLLKRGHLGTINEFKKEFFYRGNKRHPLKPRELKKKLDEVMIRRRRDETKVDYKKRVAKIIAVELTPQELDAYNSMCELLKKEYFSLDGMEMNGRLIIFAMLPKMTSSIKSAMETLENIIASEHKYHAKTKISALRVLAKYKAIQKDSKMEKLLEIIRGIFKDNPKEQVLIYTRHPTTLRYMVEKLSQLGEIKLSIVEYLGGLDREEKSKRVLAFRNGANIMISTETGAEGLNFQFCHNLINYDLPWNPMSVEQRIGRLDRIGQSHDMNVYSLATKKTMEEHVVDLIINKMCCIGLVIGELPIILFNLGLDSDMESGRNKIEEMLMDAFIESKNNLDVFAADVKKISELVQKGIKDYQETKTKNEEILDKGKFDETKVPDEEKLEVLNNG